VASVVGGTQSQPQPREIFNNYGPKPNEALLLSYGFVMPDNPNDTYWVQLGIMDQDPYREFKLRALDALSLSLRQQLSLAEPLPSTLLAALRICLMDEREVQAFSLADLLGLGLGHGHGHGHTPNPDGVNLDALIISYRNECVMWDTLAQLLQARLDRLSNTGNHPHHQVRPHIAAMAIQYREEQRAILIHALAYLGDARRHHIHRQVAAHHAGDASSTAMETVVNPESASPLIVDMAAATRWLSSVGAAAPPPPHSSPQTGSGSGSGSGSESVVLAATFRYHSLLSSAWVTAATTTTTGSSSTLMDAYVQLLRRTRRALLRTDQNDPSAATAEQEVSEEEVVDAGISADMWLALLLMVDSADPTSLRRDFYDSLGVSAAPSAVISSPSLNVLRSVCWNPDPALMEALEATPLLDAMSERSHALRHAWRTISQRLLPLLLSYDGDSSALQLLLQHHLTWDRFCTAQFLISLCGTTDLDPHPQQHVIFVPFYHQCFYHPLASFKLCRIADGDGDDAPARAWVVTLSTSTPLPRPPLTAATPTTTSAFGTICSNLEFRSLEDVVVEMGFLLPPPPVGVGADAGVGEPYSTLASSPRGGGGGGDSMWWPHNPSIALSIAPTAAEEASDDYNDGDSNIHDETIELGDSFLVRMKLLERALCRYVVVALAPEKHMCHPSIHPAMINSFVTVSRYAVGPIASPVITFPRPSSSRSKLQA
jgi:hypothetical protein